MTDEKYARMDAKLQQIARLVHDLRWEISEDLETDKRCVLPLTHVGPCKTEDKHEDNDANK